MGPDRRGTDIPGMIKSICGGRRWRIHVAGLALLALTTACNDIVDVELDLCPRDDSEVGKVTVAPRTWTLDVGDSLTVRVDVVNRRGNWSLCLPPPTFSSSDTLVARVISNGGLFGDGTLLSMSSTVVGAGKGRAYIKAKSAGVSDSLLVTVVSSP